MKIDDLLNDIDSLKEKIDETLNDDDRSHKDEIADIIELAKQRTEMYARNYGIKDEA